MAGKNSSTRFNARLQQPRDAGEANPWAFVVLPKEISAALPRRGRTSVAVVLNDYRFETFLEPDGQKSHWLAVDQQQLEASGVSVGSEACLEVTALDKELEPELPDDLAKALAAAPAAQATWDATTTVARIDWIHWVVSAKQQATRAKRIHDACDMLASGKKRVCCFDPSGFYSKAFSAPEAAS
ncbi:MAG: YdeI/OmpD-associated family protein [Nevskiales bacterium]